MRSLGGDPAKICCHFCNPSGALINYPRYNEQLNGEVQTHEEIFGKGREKQGSEKEAVHQDRQFATGNRLPIKYCHNKSVQNHARHHASHAEIDVCKICCINILSYSSRPNINELRTLGSSSKVATEFISNQQDRASDLPLMRNNIGFPNDPVKGGDSTTCIKNKTVEYRNQIVCREASALASPF